MRISFAQQKEDSQNKIQLKDYIFCFLNILT